jgi:hypothetical protein
VFAWVCNALGRLLEVGLISMDPKFSITCALVLLTFLYDYTGKIIRVPSGVMHGKSSPVYYDEVVGKDLFEGLAKYDFSTI